MIPLFAYGTLRDAAYQRALFGRVYPTVPATLAGWRIVVAETGYFTVVADPGGRCAGSLVALDRRALAIADDWEGEDYRRLRVRARDDGGERDCWLYVRASASLAPPPAGAAAMHPPAAVLAAIRSLRRARGRSGRRHR